jgi:hypothetical protein
MQRPDRPCKPLVALILLAFLSAPAWSLDPTARNFGLGAYVAGSDNGFAGFSGKYWLSSTHAFRGGLTWDRDFNTSLAAFYERHWMDAFKIDIPGKLAPLAGFGGWLGIGTTSNTISLGAQVPLGITYLFDPVPIDLFLEFAPGMVVIPAPSFDITAFFGGHYYF